MTNSNEDEMQSVIRNFARLEHQDVLVIGSLISDISCQYNALHGDDRTPKQGSSNGARITQCVGGVAHNIALSANHLNASVLLTSVIGVDDAGDFLIRQLQKEGLKIDGLITLRMYDDGQPVRTGQYVRNYDADKNFLFGMADVDLMEHPLLEYQKVWGSLFSSVQPLVTVLDTTFSPVGLDLALCHAKNSGAVVIVEPVSVPRAIRLVDTLIDFSDFVPKNKIDICTPNEDELLAMFDQVERNKCMSKDRWRKVLGFDECLTPSYLDLIEKKLNLMQLNSEELMSLLYKTVLLLPIIPAILVTLGERGCLVAMLASYKAKEHVVEDSEWTIITANESEDVALLARWYAPLPIDREKIVSVNGVGDSLVGALATGIAIARKNHDKKEDFLRQLPVMWSSLVDLGQKAATYTLQSATTVNPWLRFMRGQFDTFKNDERMRSH